MPSIESFDDLMPNDGSAFDPSFITPPEQEKEEQTAQAKAESNYPIIDELIADFEKDIAEADSLTSLGITSAMPQLQVQIISEGNSRYIENLTVKLEVLKAMRERTKR